MLIATDSAVCVRSGGDDPPRPMLCDQAVRFAAQGRRLSVIATEDGPLWLAATEEDEPAPADTGIDLKITSLLVLEDDPPHVLIGTEPPHLFRFQRGAPAARIDSFARLDVRDQWNTPWGGPPAVRSLAAAPGGGAVYADIHVGSIMRSLDGGLTWGPVTPDLNRDVHHVTTCPAAPKRVYAQTARAFYLSPDHGVTWEHRAEGLDERYGRCVAVDPNEPDRVLVTVSDGPHGDNVHGQLYRTEDAGLHWTHVSDGFPSSTKRNIDTHHVAFDPSGTAWAVVERTLYVGRDRATRWQTAWAAPERIRMIACRQAPRRGGRS